MRCPTFYLVTHVHQEGFCTLWLCLSLWDIACAGKVINAAAKQPIYYSVHEHCLVPPVEMSHERKCHNDA